MSSAAIAPAPDRVALGLLAAGAGVVLLQPFTPFDEFTRRADDAYYYFQVAANFPRHGFWTFDGINATNGVQPLWAWLLTGVATIAHAIGVDDKIVLARTFVSIAALMHVASAFLLLSLLRRTVSFGTGVVAGGALLFSMSTVWAHTWGMENSLYTLLLIGTAGYGHLVFGRDLTARRAVLYGVLLGLTGLARLNAVLLTAFAAFFFLLTHRQLGARAVMLAAVFSTTAASLVLPYAAWNYATTGHPLPVSGAVKGVQSTAYFAARGIESRWLPRAMWRVLRQNRAPLSAFASSALGDALWPIGGRTVYFARSRAIGPVVLVPLAVCAAVGLARRGREQPLLVQRSRALWPFAYVGAFAAFNALLSITLFPTQIRYAMTRWWLVEGELVLMVIAATVVAAALARAAIVVRRVQVTQWLVRAGIAVTALLSLVQTTRYYWNGAVEIRDWNSSWGNHMLLAAAWLRECAPPEARVGSWNAGVLGYHARQRVTNLDGLMNGHHLIPYLRTGSVDAYIRAQNLEYLSDAESIFTRERLTEKLPLEEVYREYMPLMKQHYLIYRVGSASAPVAGHPSAAAVGCTRVP
jgi:hypothetical protein